MAPLDPMLEQKITTVQSALGDLSTYARGLGGVPTVSPPTPGALTEPMPTAGKTLIVDDFQSYKTGSALQAVKGGPYQTNNGVLDAAFSIAPGVGPTGRQCVRIDWAQAPICGDASHLLERSFPAAPTLCVQFSVRYSPGFRFDWRGTTWPSCTGNAKKLFLLWPVTGVSRFVLIAENHALGIGSDNDHPLLAQNVGGDPVTLEALADGQWHRITLQIKQSSAPDAADGMLAGWIDGVQRWRVPTWASRSSGGYTTFKMPATFNQGSPVTQTEWLADLAVWTP